MEEAVRHNNHRLVWTGGTPQFQLDAVGFKLTVAPNGWLAFLVLGSVASLLTCADQVSTGEANKTWLCELIDFMLGQSYLRKH